MKILSGLLLACLFSVLAIRAEAQGAARIVVARVRGEVFVTVKATSVRTQVSDNAEVSQGSIVTTAKEASCVLVFSNGATINLGTDSVLDIEQYTQDPFSTPVNAATITEEPSKSNTKLSLTRGELVGKVAKLKKDQGSTFTVATPVGAAGIRGTVFRIVFRPDGNGKVAFAFTVQVGEVEVTLASGTVNGPVSLVAGKEISGDAAITVDSVSGVVTATLADGTVLTAKDASAESMSAIAASIQAFAQALLNNGINGAPSTPPGAQSQPDAVTPLAGR
jgi:hypothetical protein